MKQLLLLLAVIFSVNNSDAQTWKEMMHDQSVNIYDVVAEAEAYFENVDITAKGSGWKSYQRWLYDSERKYFPSGDRNNIDPYFAANSYKTFVKSNPLASRSPSAGGWKDLGPYYIEEVTGHYSLGLGRVESFYADPNDAERIYLGSRSGGFWKSLDGGDTWVSKTDFMFATGVNAIGVSPTNSDSVLINLRNSQNGTSHGIYRSIDAGDNWTETEFNPTNLGWGGLGSSESIYQVAYHPTIPNLIIVGAQNGLYRSSDNLTSWTKPLSGLSIVTIAFHPTNPDIIYAVASNNDSQIYISRDGGETFNTSNDIAGNGSNIKLSISAACPNCAYIGTSDGIWKSTDEGQNFSLVSNPGLSNFGAYAVSDVDPKYMLFGNIDVNMSRDEGLTFEQATYWSQGNANYRDNDTYVHADIRGSRCENGVFWVNTDGFLGKSSDNGTSWEIFEGQSIREYYNLGLSQSNHDRTIVGSQDNGTSINTESSWIEFYGADGMEGFIHPLNDDWMIGSLQYGGRRRTQDGGQSQDGVTPPGQDGAWIAPLFYDPNDHMTVYSMGENVHKSTDFGNSWTQLGTPSFSNKIEYATIAENNSKILVVTRSNQIEKSLDGGNTFSKMSPLVGGLPNSFISDVAFDPNDDNVVVVVYSSHLDNGRKVYITRNLGSTWTNITHNLGNMPVRSVVIDHTDASTIYVGTEIGIYKKAMDDDTWSLYNTDLPNMSVREMEIMYGSNTLRAVTWGRGLWEYKLDGRHDFPSILTTEITDQPEYELPKEGIDQYVTSTIAYDGTISSAYVEWSADTPVFGNAIAMSTTNDTTWVSDMPIPNQPDGTKMYFKVFAVGSNGDTTETYKFMYEVRGNEYCQSSGDMSYASAVTLVNFSGINNSTGKTQPYTDYTSSDSAIVDAGSTYDLNVHLNTDGNYSIFARAWIDWNHNTAFDDEEMYELGEATNTADGPTIFSPLSITIPNDAVMGKTTMRVSARYNTNPDPCMTNVDGEVEDYSVIVIHALPNDTVYTSICSNDSIFLGGDWQTMSGVYYDTISLPPDMDTVIITKLTVNPNSTSLEDVMACDEFTWSANNMTYSISGTYTALLTNAAGCDSSLTLNLTMNYSSTSTDTASACDSYTWPVNGTDYNTSGTYTEVLTNAAGCDSVITLILTINLSSDYSETATACDSYTWPTNGMTYTMSGTYIEDLIGTNGCDSTIILELFITSIITIVTQEDDVLTADQNGATYQWLTCPEMAPIDGATDQVYTATSNGDYAVVVSLGDCIDTSECYTVTTVGIVVNDFGNGLLVFPNPTNGDFSVDLGTTYQDIKVTITDVNGRVIKSNDYTFTELLNLNIIGASGAYLLLIESGEKKAVIRLIKE